MDAFNDFPLDPALVHESGISNDQHIDQDPDADAEAEAIEAIRVAINYNNNNSLQDSSASEDVRSDHIDLVESRADNDKPEQLERIIQQIQLLNGQNGNVLDEMGITGLLRNLEGLLEGWKKQGEVSSGLGDYLGSSGDMTTLVNLDAGLSHLYVPRAEYDDLKQKYDVILASTSGYSSSGISRKRTLAETTSVSGSGSGSTPPIASSTGSKKRKSRQTKSGGNVEPEGSEELKEAESKEQIGRKRRSVKLEHLVHQMANRRLGLEYPITNFRSAGSNVLPDPATPAPPVNMSANGIQEYRPDFTKNVEDVDVAQFVGVVVGDAWAGWVGGVGEGEMENVDIGKVQEAVETYWIRLQKRWLEQQARTRGEMHKDEITRKKQNQYRRQQSLVGRRIAAFDASPLNSCRLRSLYRTLLTLDFAAPTNERPDPSRSYTEDQWYAYRRLQLGSRAGLGHEVVDIFWLSPAVKSILILLDTYSTARTSTQKRKGRPKAPSPAFHLPPSLWDTSPSRLPLLREKDIDGLPITNSPGIILFNFHVHPDIINQYPEWAKGLYDDPPPDISDADLNSLSEILSGEGYESLVVRTKREKERQSALRELGDIEIKEILSRTEDPPEDIEEDGELIIDVDSSIIPTSTNGSMENYETIQEIGGMNLSGNIDESQEEIQSFISQEPADGSTKKKVKKGKGGDIGSFGTSISARKLGKKSNQGPPLGAALPVARRSRVMAGVGVGIGVASGSMIGNEVGVQHLHGAGQGGVERDIQRDVGFLMGL